MTPSAQTPLLSLRNISVSFGGILALADINFDVFAHEVVAIVGENAAGKSTLAKVIAGVYQPNFGHIYAAGKQVTIPNPTASKKLGIATVFQDLALSRNLDVVSNMFLGQELAHANFLNKDEMVALARQKLAIIGARIPSTSSPVGYLSAGQQQSVAIARAMLGNPSIVVLDEPTSSLSAMQSAEVLGMVERMRDGGQGIVFISHNLADVQAIADKIVVLRLGREVGHAPMSQVTYEDIIATITGVNVGLPVEQHEPVRRVAVAASAM